LLSCPEQVASEYPFIKKVDYSIDPTFFMQTEIEGARKWLHHCLENHPTCGSPSTYASLPTRLVAVGSSTRDPYLYIPGPEEKGSYLTLSYCWGEGDSLKTTKDTLGKLRTGFVLEDLPKTCQDALVVARQLGIQYIWIDRLCIIQDDGEDWVQESASMHSVYTNALLTLAALSSHGGDTGLELDQGNPRIERENAISEVELSSGRKCIVAARMPCGSSTLGFIHTWGPACLESRLWTLQEVALSRRVLWFSSAELAWSCKEATACECEPQPASRYRDRLPSHVASDLGPNSQYDKKEWLLIWYKYIEEATQRLVKVKTDRLPAVAGMASAMKRHFGGRYLAGHWEIDIEKSLLWELLEEHEFRYHTTAQLPPPMDQYYAPSWSWASVSRPMDNITGVVPDIVEGDMECKVIGMEFWPSTSNVNGPGLGILTMEGMVLAVRPPKVLRDPFEHQTEGKRFQLFSGNAEWSPDPRRDQKPMQDTDLYLIIHLRWPNDVPSNDHALLWGLVLERVNKDDFTNWKAHVQQCTSQDSTQAEAGLGGRNLRGSVDIDGMEGNVFRRVGRLCSVFRLGEFSWEEMVEEYRRQIHII
jgi:hypothetical protein